MRQQNDSCGTLDFFGAPRGWESGKVGWLLGSTLKTLLPCCSGDQNSAIYLVLSGM